MFVNRSESLRVLSSNMANKSSCNVLHGVQNEHEILQLSDATYAEDLQFQEALQMSMISSQMKRDDLSSLSSLMPSQPTTPALTVKEGALSSRSSEGISVAQKEDGDEDDRDEYELQLQEALRMSMIPSQMKRDDPSYSSLMPSQSTTPAWTVKEGELSLKSSEDITVFQDEDGDDDDGAFNDSDEYDCDLSPESHETSKNNKWFKKFFEEEINKCQWHCPACKGGPGAVKWFHRLQDLIIHAKTKGARRVKLHREFAKLLEAEVRGKRPLDTPAAAVKVVGKWKGLKEEEEDHQIVWPPVVVFRNTSIRIDNKWIGMRSQELLQLFSSYDAIKAHHFYGPQGHRGVSLLIFESSAAGYTEAERLHKSLSKQGIGRDAWNSCLAAATIQGGVHQLYGYLAVKEDLNFLNKYCQGKLKYEMKSYREVIVNQIKKMSEDSQQLIWVKEKLVEEEMHVKSLEESVCAQRKKLHLKTEEVSKLKQRVQQLHEEHQEEIKFQENFFKDQIRDLEANVTKEGPEASKQAESDINQMEEYEEI